MERRIKDLKKIQKINSLQDNNPEEEISDINSDISIDSFESQHDKSDSSFVMQKYI